MFKRKMLSYVMMLVLLVGTFVVGTPVEVVKAAWVAPEIKYPATIYFGGYANMDQLVKDGARWDYVKKNMDGFLFHGAYWNNNQEAFEVGQKLAAMLEPYNKKMLVEGGFPHPPFPTDGSVGNIGVRTGQMDGSMVQAIRSMGFNLNQMTSNYNLYFAKMIKNYNPDYNTTELLVEATGDRYSYPTVKKPENNFWVDYYSQIVKTYPNIAYSHTNSPVYLSWDSYNAISSSALMFRDINITGNMLIESAFNGANNAIGKRMTGFVMDSPYAYFNWPGQTGVEFRQKIRAIESWLHNNNYTNTFVVNADGFDSLSQDQADQRYYEDSMAAFKQYQGEGGRADTYLFESWYPWPYTVAPENTSGSYTNLVKDAIKYLKGIGEDYSFEKLDLEIKESGDSVFFGSNIYKSEPGDPQFLKQKTNTATKVFTVQMKNNGDVECMPNLRALESGSSGWTVNYYYGDVNITSQVLSDLGYTFSNKLPVFSTISLTVTVTPNGATNGSYKEFDLVAFWNPQDPTGKVRDVVSAEVTKDTSIVDTLRASDALGMEAAAVTNYNEPMPSGIYEAENATRNGVGVAANNPNFTGSGFTDSWDTQNDSATFTVDGKAGGNKQVFIRYANAQNSPRTLSVYVNDVKVKQLSFPTVEVNNWSKWGTISLRSILNPGSNSIKIMYDQGDNGIINIDNITVLDSTIYDAEDALLSGVTYEPKVTGYQEDSFVNDWNSVGDSLEVSVDGGTGGSTSFTIRYSNGSSSAKTLSLYVNNVKIRQLSFSPTGSDSNWSTLNTGSVNLNPGRGNNSIKLKYDSDDTGGINVDNFTKSGDTKKYSAEGQILDNGVMLRGTKIGAVQVLGSGFVKGWTNNGQFAQFTTSQVTSGTKTLSIRYKNDTSSDMTLSLYVDGIKLRQIILPAYVETCSWPSWRNINEVVTLNAGAHMIKLQKDAADLGNVMVDAIELIDGSISMDSSYTSLDASPANAIYEAETATLSGVYPSKNSDPTDSEYFTGLGYTVGWDAVNDSATFSVNSETSEVKLLKIYYQNTSDTTMKSASLYVNNEKITQMQFAPGDQDGDPGYFSQRGMSVYKKYVQLNSGMNSISIKLDPGNTGFNRLDKITITDLPSSLSKNGWNVTASSSSQGEGPERIVDNDLTTRWTSGQFQSPSGWVVVDMLNAKVFNKIVLASAGEDYPRSYSIYTSNDGNNWGSSVASGNGYYSNDIEISLPQQNARYFKIVQTGISTTNYWSINELNVYNASKVMSYEAEKAILSNVSVNDNHTNFTGAGFVDGWNTQNDALTFIVQGGNSGGYRDLNIRYSVGNGSSKSLSLYVNGVKIKQLLFPATLNWDTWRTLNESVVLSQGLNQIKLQWDTNDNGQLNIDHISLIN